MLVSCFGLAVRSAPLTRRQLWHVYRSPHPKRYRIESRNGSCAGNSAPCSIPFALWVTTSRSCTLSVPWSSGRRSGTSWTRGSGIWPIWRRQPNWLPVVLGLRLLDDAHTRHPPGEDRSDSAVAQQPVIHSAGAVGDAILRSSQRDAADRRR